MKVKISIIEKRISQLVDSEFGAKHNLVLNLYQIKEIPIDSYLELQKQISQGKVILRQYPHSISGQTFNIIATPFEAKLSTVLSFLTFLVPIIGMMCSFLISWWCLLLVIFPIISLKMGKRIYLKTLFDRAMNSEIAFCFLFCGRLISVEIENYGIIERGSQILTYEQATDIIVDRFKKECSEENLIRFAKHAKLTFDQSDPKKKALFFIEFLNLHIGITTKCFYKKYNDDLVYDLFTEYFNQSYNTFIKDLEEKGYVDSMAFYVDISEYTDLSDPSGMDAFKFASTFYKRMTHALSGLDKERLSILVEEIMKSTALFVNNLRIKWLDE